MWKNLLQQQVIFSTNYKVHVYNVFFAQIIEFLNIIIDYFEFWYIIYLNSLNLSSSLVIDSPPCLIQPGETPVSSSRTPEVTKCLV